MEKLTVMYASRKYDLHKGEEYDVLRDINDRCVLITTENKPNVVMTEAEAMTYGYLRGRPQLGGV